MSEANAPAVNHVGIEGTKSVLKLVIGSFNVLHAAKADGKIDLSDLGQLLPLIPTIAPALEGMKGVPGEVTDLSAEEVASLSAFVTSELKIAEGKSKEVIEASFKLIAATVVLIAAIKA